MTISTKTNSTALRYLSIITNKTVEMIGMKIFRFVEVATLSHRQKKLVDFLRFYEGTAVIYVNREGCEWQVEWIDLQGRIFSMTSAVDAPHNPLAFFPTVQKFWWYSTCIHKVSSIEKKIKVLSNKNVKIS